MKPKVKLTGQDGNIFNLVGIASREMKRNGLAEEARKMQGEIMSCGSYDEALHKISEYCEVS